MTFERKRGQAALGVVVALLAIAVVVQGVLLYKLYRDAHPAQAAASAGVRARPSEQAAATGPSAPASGPQAAAPKWGDDVLDDAFWPFWGEDPFEAMERMRERMNRLFDRTFRWFRERPDWPNRWQGFSFAPELDLYDDGENYVVRFNIPGAEKSEINVHLDDRVLTVTGRTDERVERKEGDRILRVERRTGRFERSTTLPGPVDSANMKADYKDGVLTVIVPKKRAETQPRTIKVS